MAEGALVNCAHCILVAICSPQMGHVTGVKWGVVAPEDVKHGLRNIFFQKVSCTVHAWKCHTWVQALFDLGVPLMLAYASMS